MNPFAFLNILRGMYNITLNPDPEWVKNRKELEIEAQAQVDAVQRAWVHRNDPVAKPERAKLFEGKWTENDTHLFILIILAGGAFVCFLNYWLMR